MRRVPGRGAPLRGRIAPGRATAVARRLGSAAAAEGDSGAPPAFALYMGAAAAARVLRAAAPRAACLPSGPTFLPVPVGLSRHAPIASYDGVSRV